MKHISLWVALGSYLAAVLWSFFLRPAPESDPILIAGTIVALILVAFDYQQNRGRSASGKKRRRQ